MLSRGFDLLSLCFDTTGVYSLLLVFVWGWVLLNIDCKSWCGGLNVLPFCGWF